MPDEDRYTYAEGLRRGGYLLSVNVTDAQYAKALDILDDEGTIDIDERTQMWRKEGWSDKDYQSYSHGTSGGRSAATAGQTDYERTTGRKTSAQSGTKGREEAIPIVEEQLRVGKREVGGGVFASGATWSNSPYRNRSPCGTRRYRLNAGPLTAR